MNGRGNAVGLLLSEQAQARRPKPKRQGMTGEDLLRLLSGAAPIAGTVAGTIAGGPAGAAIGGGVGGLAGLGAGFAADQMAKKREEEALDEDEEYMADLARKQKLAAFL